MGLIQKAESYGSKYRGHHLNAGGKFREKKLTDGRLKEHKLKGEERLNADHY